MPKFSRIFPILALAAATLALAGTPHQSASAPASQPTAALLDLNIASPAELKSLPGMGDAYVRRVMENRPYTAKNQLLTRGILPQSAYAKISAYIIAKHPATH